MVRVLQHYWDMTPDEIKTLSPEDRAAFLARCAERSREDDSDYIRAELAADSQARPMVHSYRR